MLRAGAGVADDAGEALPTAPGVEQPTHSWNVDAPCFTPAAKVAADVATLPRRTPLSADAPTFYCARASTDTGTDLKEVLLASMRWPPLPITLFPTRREFVVVSKPWQPDAAADEFFSCCGSDDDDSERAADDADEAGNVDFDEDVLGFYRAAMNDDSDARAQGDGVAELFAAATPLTPPPTDVGPSAPEVGDVVVLRDLASAAGAALNGQQGVVCAPVVEGRVQVRLEGGREVKVKPAHLFPAAAPVQQPTAAGTFMGPLPRPEGFVCEPEPIVMPVLPAGNGDLVELVGFSNPKLNGQRGFFRAYDAAFGGSSVGLLASRRFVGVRPEQVMFISARPAVCNVTGEALGPMIWETFQCQ